MPERLDSSTWMVVGILLVMILLWIVRKKRDIISYRKILPFTKTEREFLRALDMAIGERYRIFGKMRIADVIMPAKGLSKKEWGRHFFRVTSKHLDYVLCDYDTLEIVCVIELNDKSHEREDRKKRDIFVEKACKSANLPLLWIPQQKSYDRKLLAKEIIKKIAQK